MDNKTEILKAEAKLANILETLDELKKTRVCSNCGVIFVTAQNRKDTKYCSGRCRVAGFRRKRKEEENEL